MCIMQMRTTGPRQVAARAVAVGSLALALAACSPANETGVAGGSSPSPGRSPTPAPDPSPTLSPSPAPTPTDEATSSPTAPVAEELDPEVVFAYDVDAPLELTDVGTIEELGQEIRDVTYASPHGGQVPAYIAEPTEDPAGVGILLTPGIPETRNAYPDLIARMACAGATAMVVDAPWARGEMRVADEAFQFIPEDRDNQIQLVVDLRRAVDVLEAQRSQQIGFTAFSYGAGIGAMLAGVDDRIDAFALLSGGPGPIARFTDAEGQARYPLASRSDEEQQAWLEAMEPVEPIHFVDDATAPILISLGRDDTTFPPSAVERFLDAAGPNAEVRWYDAGHDLTPQALMETLEWLAEELGLDQGRLASCFEGAF